MLREASLLRYFHFLDIPVSSHPCLLRYSASLNTQSEWHSWGGDYLSQTAGDVGLSAAVMQLGFQAVVMVTC